MQSNIIIYILNLYQDWIPCYLVITQIIRVFVGNFSIVLKQTSPRFFIVVRDQDGHIYFRENNGRLLAGGFEPVAKPAYEDGKILGKYKYIAYFKILLNVCFS